MASENLTHKIKLVTGLTAMAVEENWPIERFGQTIASIFCPWPASRILNFLSTKELADELAKRPGVEERVFAAYSGGPVAVEGPAVVLVVKD